MDDLKSIDSLIILCRIRLVFLAMVIVQGYERYSVLVLLRKTVLPDGRRIKPLGERGDLNIRITKPIDNFQ